MPSLRLPLSLPQQQPLQHCSLLLYFQSIHFMRIFCMLSHSLRLDDTILYQISFLPKHFAFSQFVNVCSSHSFRMHVTWRFLFYLIFVVFFYFLFFGFQFILCIIALILPYTALRRHRQQFWTNINTQKHSTYIDEHTERTTIIRTLTVYSTLAACLASNVMLCTTFCMAMRLM